MKKRNKKKKIGIVTITGGANYGNRLQNYAMQTVLNKLGYDAFTIRKEDEKKTIIRKVKTQLKHILRFKYTLLDRRIEKFEKFNKKYIKFSKNHIKSDVYDPKLSGDYDGFVCGSYQILNPNYKTNTDSYYLSFVEGKKRISVAASFGVEVIDDKEKDKIKQNLNKLDAISVREYSGKIICENLVDKDIYVLVDPTLMLNKEEWERLISKNNQKIKRDYIFCYLLGEQEENVIQRINEYAKNNDLEIVWLEDIWRDAGVSSDEEYIYGPSEFLCLLKGSCKVITNSYHAAIFSMIFSKELSIVPRKKSGNDMSSRFKTLFDRLKIDYKSDQLLSFLQIDSDALNEILISEKNKFMKFIENNL